MLYRNEIIPSLICRQIFNWYKKENPEELHMLLLWLKVFGIFVFMQISGHG